VLTRLLSGDSHDDFKPKKKAVLPDLSDGDAVQALIDEHVKSHPVLLYMKGTPSAPQCGFSQQVVRILHATGESDPDVPQLLLVSLKYWMLCLALQAASSAASTSWSTLRYAMESRLTRTCAPVKLIKPRPCANDRTAELHVFFYFAVASREWPTIPQLYVAGEFVGGCDIVTDQYQSGELAALMEEANVET
jgi:glutaredoxin-related protein